MLYNNEHELKIGQECLKSISSSVFSLPEVKPYVAFSTQQLPGFCQDLLKNQVLLYVYLGLYILFMFPE